MEQSHQLIICCLLIVPQSLWSYPKNIPLVDTEFEKSGPKFLGSLTIRISQRGEGTFQKSHRKAVAELSTGLSSYEVEPTCLATRAPSLSLFTWLQILFVGCICLSFPSGIL